MGHVPSHCYRRSQYLLERTIEDLPLARLDGAAAQEPASSFGSPNELRGLHQGLQACGGNRQLENGFKLLAGLLDKF